MTKTISFFRSLSSGAEYKLGSAVYYPNGPGWRFISNVSSHKSSRKFHATMEACIPRWVGYPDKCRSTDQRITENWSAPETVT